MDTTAVGPDSLQGIYDLVNMILGHLFTWPGIVFMFCIFFVLLCRKPIRDMISKFKRIEAGKFKAETASPETQVVVPEKKGTEVQEVKQEETRVAEVEQTKLPNTVDEWEVEMKLAVIARDRVRLENSHSELTKLLDDSLARKKSEITYLGYAHSLGNTDALPRLRDYLSDQAVAYEANMVIGECYINSNDYQTAAVYLAESLKDASDEEQRSLAASYYARALYSDNRKTEAIDVLIEVLNSISGSEFRTRLYRSIAEIYKKEGDKVNRAIALDKALELTPNDTGLLFKTALAYSESNCTELALLHYLAARSIDPSSDAVQNNLAVAYADLNMPIRSISSYKEAQRLGSTLASSNLAYRLIRVGFIEEASATLQSAMAKAEVHQNVNAALSEISRRVEKEDKIEEDKRKAALTLRKFFLSYGEAKFTKGALLKSAGGIWVGDNDTSFQIQVSDDLITCSWTSKIISYKTHHKFEGVILNNSAQITFFEMEYSFEKSITEFKKKGQGLLYHSKDGSVIQFIDQSQVAGSANIITLKSSAGSH